ncbi:hypothetical protein AgCh_006790 [Apium graveolens]
MTRCMLPIKGRPGGPGGRRFKKEYCKKKKIYKDMSSFVTIYLHHHGDLTSPPNVSYIGGKVETLHNVDTDVFSFRDLDDFAVKYDYDPSALVYFKSDGSSFRNGVSLLYDDDTVREMVELHKPYGKISLFVDHFELDNLVDMPTTPTELNNKQPESNLENEANGSSEDDPEYDAETESESDSDESDNGSLYLDSDEDEELKNNSEDGKDMCLRRNQSRGLEDAVRGPLGNVAVFEPIPPHTPFMPVGSRTSASAVTTSQAPATSSKTSKSSAPSEAPPRRSARMLMKGKFNFKNSEDEPVFLGED